MELLQKKPFDYVRLVFRRKWLIIVPTVIGLVGGIIFANILPKKYESSTLILVEEGRVINPLIQGLAVSTSVAQRLAILREQILGWDRMNQLISQLELAKNVKTQEDFENLVKGLRKNIRVKLRGRNIVGISYIGSDPMQTMHVVKAITDIFIAENLRQQSAETEDAISFINDQLDLYRKKLKQSEISGMEEKLNDLLIDSTEKHPLVIELKKKIEVTQKEMDEGNFEMDADTISASDSELITLKQEVKQLRDEITSSGFGSVGGGANRAKLTAATNEQLYKLLLLEKVEKATLRDAGVNQGLYNELLKRLETAKLTQRLEASKDGTRYTILDPARLPLRPAKPNKLMVLFMGLFLGLCGGMGLVFSVEMFDHSFLGVDEAKAYLDLPILGGIAKIITQADVRKQKNRNIQITSISALTGVALLLVIIFNIILGS